jgi:hypothetical protein
MDPLSIATAVVGILSAAVKVRNTLGPIVSTLKDKTKSAAAICVELNHSITILSALQTFIDDLNTASHTRRQLIHIDQLIIAFTDGVLLFSELESLVLKLGTSPDHLRARIQWARKEKDFAFLLTRMQRFKGSITVMLNILQR